MFCSWAGFQNHFFPFLSSFSFGHHYLALKENMVFVNSSMTKNCINIICICILFLQVMKNCSKLGKIMLVALVHELYKTGMGETTFEKVSRVIFLFKLCLTCFGSLLFSLVKPLLFIKCYIGQTKSYNFFWTSYACILMMQPDFATIISLPSDWDLITVVPDEKGRKKPECFLIENNDDVLTLQDLVSTTPTHHESTQKLELVVGLRALIIYR